MVKRKAQAIGAIAFFLCAAAIAALMDPVSAQSTDVEDAQATLESETDLPGQYEQLLKMALGNCLKEPSGFDPDTVVTIGFDIDENGQLSGIPEYRGTSIVSADARRLFLNGATALDKCAPYPPEGRRASFEVVFSSSGFQSLRRLSDPLSIHDPSVRQAAAAVHKPASQETEAALSLNRAKRSEIQRRLQLLGFDPKGADGVFGQNTREALSAWQEDKGFPANGFLSAVQLLALNAQSQAGYADYIAKNPQAKKVRRRVEVCRPVGLLGLRRCRYEYR